MAGAVVDLPEVRGRDAVTDAADVVVVGSGAAGATVARVLSERGLDVAIVEEGPSTPRDGFRQDAYTAFRGLWRDLGFQVAKGRAFIPILQGRAVGGTTVINGAIIHRIPEDVHAEWAADGAIDGRLSHAELERVFQRLDDELSVGPAPEEVLGGNNRLMREGAGAIGATGNVIQRVVDGCRGAARCTQGCPTGRKQSMHLTYVPYAVERGARVYASCRVERIVMRGNRATGVEARFRAPVGREVGPPLHVEARVGVVVAASAIQTPGVLEASGVRHRLLGRRLQAHPGTGVMGAFDEPVRMWFGATQGWESPHWRRSDRMKMEVVGVPLEIGAARLPGFGAALMDRIADFGHVAQWGVQVRARGMGRVRRGRGGAARIAYDLAREDIPHYKRGIERLVRMMFEAGAREVWPGVHGLPEAIASPDGIRAIHDLPDDARRFHFIAAHLFGTAAMHADPRRGVVAPDGAVHGTRGLWVADSSVFPTNLGVNPQHTISAVAWRIAEMLPGPG